MFKAEHIQNRPCS